MIIVTVRVRVKVMQ